jgi:mRNA-degrading endonuclease toxin of MazEF toxin-antitoxin module
VVSLPRYHRKNNVVALPLSRHVDKARGHLIKVIASEITMEDGNPSIDRVALTDQVRCLDKTRFRKKAGFLSSKGMSAVLLGLDIMVGNRREPPPISN